MPIFKIARYRIRPEARDAVEQAMREYAKRIAFDAPGSTWVTYRDAKDADLYVSLIGTSDPAAFERDSKAEGTRLFVDALYPNVVGEVEWADYEPVASSQ